MKMNSRVMKSKVISLLIIGSLILPNVTHAESTVGSAPTNTDQSGISSKLDTRDWIESYKESIEKVSNQKEIKPEDIPSFTRDELQAIDWYPFEVDSVWKIYNSFDRSTLKVAAYFYPTFDRFLSHDEQVEKYEWTDQAVQNMLKNLSADQLTQLREYIPFILDYYNAGKKEPQKLPSSSLSTSVPDAMYDSDGLTYNYKRPNTDSPVDDLYKTANIKESDLHLDGKHGMDVTIERRYSSLNSNTNDIYYSSGGTNKRTSFSNYQDEYFMPHGWKLNLPKFEEIDKTNVRCSYREERLDYYCSNKNEGKRYVFTLDDGSVLESSTTTGTWVNTPYEGAKMQGYGQGSMENGIKDIVTLYVNGFIYEFQIENSGGEDVRDTHVITKKNVYGDQITYRIPEDHSKNIQIIDTVGRLIELKKNTSNVVTHVYVYENNAKTKLLKHTEYAWNTTSNTDRIIEHAVNGTESKIIAEYNYHDSSLYGKAEFNLKPIYYLPSTNKEIPLDYNGIETSTYTNDDLTKRGTYYYKLLKQVKYPVEGLSMTYSYSPYNSEEPDFLKRGVVRLYHDDEKLTYSSYHPVTSVNFRFAKTSHPDDSSSGTYSHTVYYPQKTQEIWTTQKDTSVRLKNQSARDGAKIVTNTIQTSLPNFEKTFVVNEDKNFLLQSEKKYIGNGSMEDSILGELSVSENGTDYLYTPVSYTSYMYLGRGTKPQYTFTFLGQPDSITQDKDVYQFLLEPDPNRLSKVKSRLSKYALFAQYTYNNYGDIIKEVDPKGNVTKKQYLVTGTYLRLPTEVEVTAASNPNYFHKEIYTYNPERLLINETILDSYPDGRTTKLDQMDRSYTYKDKLLTSFTETTTGQDAKSFTQSIHSYDSLGLYPEAIDMSVETQPGVQTDLFHYFGYDGLGRLNARVYPDQSYVTYEYDLLGRMTSEQFTNQDQTRTTSYAYDDSTRKVTVTLPDGSKSFTHFTPYGDVEYKGQIDVNGKIRPLLYNTYALNGNHLSTSEPFAIKDRAINYHYNEDGSLLLKDDPIGDTVFLKANSMRDGDRYVAADTILTINPNGLHSTQYYDQYGQLAKESSKTEDRTQELVTSYERDEFGQVMGKKQIDQRGEERAWEFRYTTNGNLVYLLDPEKNSYYYEYDAYGNLATVTENSTLTTKNHYNALSWKISEQDVPSGAKESYIYNVNGKPASFIDKAGNRLEYTYTPFYDLSSLITKNASGTIKNKETTEYFPHTSLVKRETNSNGANVDPSSNNFREISYNYDSHNRLTGIRTFGRDYVLGYSDRDDVIDELTYPDGMKVTYSYDAGERLQEVRSPMTGVIRYDYRIDNKGDSYHVEYPNGRTTDKVYDSFGQATKMTQSLNGAPIWKESNQYAFGNIINIQRNDTSYQFDYDKTDRLTRESQSDQTNLYSYDQRGNRSAFEGETKSATGSVAYTFDERNRLRGITNEQTADSETYTYYGDGLRATKAGNDSETKYVYVNGKVIEELDGSGNVKARNIWGNELLFREDFAANKSGYYGYNSHGDVIVISDENGHEINTYDYDAWGNIVSETEGMENPFKYSGEIYDEKTGLYYLRARYYDPSVGRFISEDTYKGQVDNPLSLNRYTYVHNNPLRFIDPTGHWNQAIGANWVINEAKNKWALAQTVGEKRHWENYANDIRAKMTKAGYSKSDIMQSSEAMITDSQVMNMARESAPGLAFVADFSNALWDYPGEAAAVKGAFIVGSIFNKGKGFSRLDEGLNFASTAATHMDEAGRFIPVQIQQSVIKYGKGLPDPRGSNATMYYDVMYKNNKKYNVEVLYDAETNTVFHFKYTDREIRNGSIVFPATK